MDWMADTANEQLDLREATVGSAESEQEGVPITRQGFEDRDVHGRSSTFDEHWWYFHHAKASKVRMVESKRCNNRSAKNGRRKASESGTQISSYDRKKNQRKFQVWSERGAP